MFVALAFELYEELQKNYTSWSVGDVAAFAVFMFGVAFCFTLSAAFHTCASHSQEGYHLARRLDFQGIVVLVLSTSAPQVYYTFYDEPILQRNYWYAVSKDQMPILLFLHDNLTLHRSPRSACWQAS